jgi:hypothetical protein
MFEFSGILEGRFVSLLFSRDLSSNLRGVKVIWLGLCGILRFVFRGFFDHKILACLGLVEPEVH